MSVSNGEQLHPTDLRWWVIPCAITFENRCSPENPKLGGGCSGCLHNGFAVDLTGIKMVVDKHPHAFRGRRWRDDGPKPWDDDFFAREVSA